MRSRRSSLTPLARVLRGISTDAESRLWRMLRNRNMLGCKFRRQFPIGDYIADFICIEKRLIVELDGGQHLERTALDELRSSFLRERGFRVLRFWNDDVLPREREVPEQIVGAVA
jgi:primosomal protein N' (replication factor Y)